jgi:isopentenyldiphosphate isomerase
VRLADGVLPRRWFRVEACVETGWEFVWIYHLRHDGPVVIDEREIQFAEWVEPAEVSRRVANAPADFCPSFKLIWPLAVNRLAEVAKP